MEKPAKGQVWLVELPEGKGHEQKGQRPAVMASDLHQSQLIAIIPLTSSLDKKSFAYACSISPSAENGLHQESIALIFQLSTLSTMRFTHKMGKLSQQDQATVDELLKDFLKLK